MVSRSTLMTLASSHMSVVGSPMILAAEPVRNSVMATTTEFLLMLWHESFSYFTMQPALSSW